MDSDPVATQETNLYKYGSWGTSEWHMTSKFNITYASGDWRAQQLCPFVDSPLILESVHTASIESFASGIRFPYTDPRRSIALRSHGIEAHMLASGEQKRYVWWNGEVISYGSPAHRTILQKAIRDRFRMDARAQVALAATVGRVLMHKPPKQALKTALGPQFYCKTLTTLRDSLIATGKISLKPR